MRAARATRAAGRAGGGGGGRGLLPLGPPSPPRTARALRASTHRPPRSLGAAPPPRAPCSHSPGRDFPSPYSPTRAHARSLSLPSFIHIIRAKEAEGKVGSLEGPWGSRVSGHPSTQPRGFCNLWNWGVCSLSSFPTAMCLYLAVED